MSKIVSKLNISEFTTISPNQKFTLVDNSAVIEDGRMALLVQSKYESESIPKLDNMTTLELLDIFNDDILLTSTATSFFEKTGITVNRKVLTSATTTLACNGEIFSYNSTLTASIGDIQATISIHPGAMNPNSVGRRVDLNILGWYLVFKTKGYDVNISSKDSNLLKSAKTFSFQQSDHV